VEKLASFYWRGLAGMIYYRIERTPLTLATMAEYMVIDDLL